MTNGIEGGNETNYYRGMPFQTDHGVTAFASARDIGNYAAGRVAGRSNFSWSFTRVCFDTYQLIKSRKFEREPPISTIPQYLDWANGIMK